MPVFLKDFRATVAIACGLALLSCSDQATAQLIRAPLDTGFARTSSIQMTVDEMLGSRKSRANEPFIYGPGFPDVWIAEVQFKPLRYRRIEVTDPASGQKQMELVWYMVYRVIPRDYTELAGDSRDELIVKLCADIEGDRRTYLKQLLIRDFAGAAATDLETKLTDANLLPQNELDTVPRSPLMVPRFVLSTDDSEEQQHYVDEVNLEIQQNVLAREILNRNPGVQLLNSVEGIGEVDEWVSVSDPDQLNKARYGVAVWRNVDPTTDYFTVTISGFSNAYRISQNDAGQTVVEHKVIEQRFGRPGDEFNQQEDEFRIIDKARLAANGDVIVSTDTITSVYPPGRAAPAFVERLRTALSNQIQTGEASFESGKNGPELQWPRWEYQPRAGSIAVPDFDRILRNARNTTPSQEQ